MDITVKAANPESVSTGAPHDHFCFFHLGGRASVGLAIVMLPVVVGPRPPGIQEPLPRWEGEKDQKRLRDLN